MIEKYSRNNKYGILQEAMVNADSLGDTITRDPENRGNEILTQTIAPRILEHGKVFHNGEASEFYNLKYTPGMERDSKSLRDMLPISSTNPIRTVTYGYWPFGQQATCFIQAVNLSENILGGSGTNRPFVQRRVGIIDQKELLDIYASGIRPLASTLVDAYPDEAPYLLQRYDSVSGQTSEEWKLVTDVKSIWKIHQDNRYRLLATRAAEAVLAKRLVRIGNPVVLEHGGELEPHLLPCFIDTVNVLVKAINHRITTLSAINTASMDIYSDVDLVIRDMRAPLTTTLYPSYILNRNGNSEEVIPGHYSTPAFRQTPEILSIYDTLHGSTENWIKNHKQVLIED